KHISREDRITTYQYGGKHRFWSDISMDWKGYSSKASQDSDEYSINMNADGNSGVGRPLAGEDYTLPIILPINEMPLIREPRTFVQTEPSGVGYTRSKVHRIKFSEDERKGFHVNLEKKYEVGSV